MKFWEPKEIYSLLYPDYEDNKLLIGSVEFKSMELWRNYSLKTSGCIFIRIKDTFQILAITKSGSQNYVIGAWDIRNVIGFCYRSGSLCITLKDSVYVTFPDRSITKGNKELLNLGESPEIKKISEYAERILISMVTSPEHKNKSNMDLAIQAIKLSQSYHSCLDDFISLKHSASFNQG